MKRERIKTAFIAFLAGMILFHAAILWRAHSPVLRGYGDFAAFYTAGKLVQEGHAAGIYDPHQQWRIQQQFASTVSNRLGPLPYVRPPFEALIFLPFAYLSYPAACLVWILIKIGVLFAIPFILRPVLPPDRTTTSLLIGLLSLAFFPVAFDLLQGQDSVLLLLIFSMVFVALRRGANFRAGLFLALGLFKFHLVLPLALVFLLRKKWTSVLGFSTTAIALCLTSVWLVGWAGVLNYPRYLWALDRTPGLGMTMGQQSMPNVRGVVAGLFGFASMPGSIRWALLTVMGLGIVFVAFKWNMKREEAFRVTAAGFSLAIAVTIATSYYAYGYDMILLLLPIVLLGKIFLDSSEISGWPRTVFMVCVGLLLFSPLQWLLIMRLGKLYWMVLVLLLFSASLMKAVDLWQSAVPDRQKLGSGV